MRAVLGWTRIHRTIYGLRSGVAARAVLRRRAAAARVAAAELAAGHVVRGRRAGTPVLALRRVMRGMRPLGVSAWGGVLRDLWAIRLAKLVGFWVGGAPADDDSIVTRSLSRQGERHQLTCTYAGSQSVTGLHFWCHSESLRGLIAVCTYLSSAQFRTIGALRCKNKEAAPAWKHLPMRFDREKNHSEMTRRRAASRWRSHCPCTQGTAGAKIGAGVAPSLAQRAERDEHIWGEMNRRAGSVSSRMNRDWAKMN